jgi:peptidoglycan/xylan/chitin deacetylase (PgdA/CDA1 family)
MLDRKKIVKTVMGRIAGISGAFERAFGSTTLIVGFHRVNDQMPEDGLTCGSAKFEAFCRFFRKYARVVPLSEQVAACREGKDMSGTVSITFDDGYLDNFEVAAPILHRLQMPATFFITSGFIGSQVIPPWDVELVRQPGWMTWDHLRSLVAQGFEIGCHTDTHIDMGRADADTVRRELEVSKQKINQELGITVQLFAYPFGDRQNISDCSRQLVRDLGFVCCASSHGGLNAVGTSPFHLQRVPIAEWFATPDQFGFEFVRGLWQRNKVWASSDSSPAGARD